MKDEVSIDDFGKLDIRIGAVIKAEVPEWSHWVMRLTVDFGEEIGTRTIFSGIMKFYQPEELLNGQFPFIINLKPKRIGPPNENGEYEYSQGMMMMAVEGEANDEETKPTLFCLKNQVLNGTVVR
jgi:methionine--tRNA ligase beta chain